MNRKLTKTIVENAKAPTKGDAWIWDTELPGFGLRIKPSGRKTYVVRYRTRDGSRAQRKVTVCRATDATPDKARALARDIFMSVAAGMDPAEERRRRTDDRPTIEQMFEGYVEHLRSKGKPSADVVEHALLLSSKASADALGRETAPADVTPHDIIKHLATFYKSGHRGAANKARSYIHAAYNWAIKSAHDYTVEVRKDWGVTHNPVAAVAKDPDAVKVRDRNLSADEIRIFWQACEDGSAGFTPGVEACLKAVLTCGQRVQETLRMCGSEIDLEQAVWRMPAHKTKGRKRDHVIPLSRHIVPKLKALKEQYGDGPLFPSDAKGGLLTSNGVAQALHKWVHSDECPFEPFQPRDLRRTWKSRTHDAGIDRFTRDLIQQHSMNDTGSKNYDRADYLPQMREAMDKWDDWLDRVLYGEPVVLKAA